MPIPFPPPSPGDCGDWRDRALCAEVGPELFYPEKAESAVPAKRVCLACEVRADCLGDALERGEMWGVWGGTSETQRRRMRRQDRQREAAAA